jgi:peptide chain release factor 1
LGEVMEGSLDDVLGPLVNEFQAEQLASLSE